MEMMIIFSLIIAVCSAAATAEEMSGYTNNAGYTRNAGYTNNAGFMLTSNNDGDDFIFSSETTTASPAGPSSFAYASAAAPSSSYAGDDAAYGSSSTLFGAGRPGTTVTTTEGNPEDGNSTLAESSSQSQDSNSRGDLYTLEGPSVPVFSSSYNNNMNLIRETLRNFSPLDTVPPSASVGAGSVSTMPPGSTPGEEIIGSTTVPSPETTQPADTTTTVESELTTSSQPKEQTVQLLGENATAVATVGMPTEKQRSTDVPAVTSESVIENEISTSANRPSSDFRTEHSEIRATTEKPEFRVTTVRGEDTRKLTTETPERISTTDLPSVRIVTTGRPNTVLNDEVQVVTVGTTRRPETTATERATTAGKPIETVRTTVMPTRREEITISTTATLANSSMSAILPTRTSVREPETKETQAPEIAFSSIESISTSSTSAKKQLVSEDSPFDDRMSTGKQTSEDATLAATLQENNTLFSSLATVQQGEKHEVNGRASVAPTSTPVPSASSFVPVRITHVSNGWTLAPDNWDYVVQFQDMTAVELENAITVATTNITAVQWLLDYDSIFRTLIVNVTSSVSAANRSVMTGLSTKGVVYVGPTPMNYERDLLLSFFVRTKADEDSTAGIVPAKLILQGIRENRDFVQEVLHLNFSQIYSGIPSSYFTSEYKTCGMFLQDTNAILLLVVMAALCVALILCIVICVKCRRDRNKGKMNSADYPFDNASEPQVPFYEVGNHLATDEQCTEGENARRRLNAGKDEMTHENEIETPPVTRMTTNTFKVSEPVTDNRNIKNAEDDTKL